MQLTRSIIDELEEMKEKIESLIETLEIMSDDELMESIKEAEKDVEEGRVVDYFELAKKLGISD